jgi:hypothetical protein
LGREVGVLLDGVRKAGWQEVTWQATGPAGVYVVRLDAGGRRAVRTVVRVR